MQKKKDKKSEDLLVLKKKLEQLKEELGRSGELILNLKLRAGAQKSEWISLFNQDILKLRIKEAPEKGRANLALLKFLAQEFELKLDELELLSGFDKTSKRVRLKKL